MTKCERCQKTTRAEPKCAITESKQVKFLWFQERSEIEFRHMRLLGPTYMGISGCQRERDKGANESDHMGKANLEALNEQVS